MGRLELRIPQDRDGYFSTELFERYQCSEQALVATLAEMCVHGVSTRKVKKITDELCGHSFLASTISTINKRLDANLTTFAQRRLDEPSACLIIDAKYEQGPSGGCGSPSRAHWGGAWNSHYLAATGAGTWMADKRNVRIRTRGLQASRTTRRTMPSPIASNMSLGVISPNFSSACSDGKNRISAVTLIIAAAT